MKNQINNHFFENLFYQSNIPSIIWNREFKIIRINAAFEKFTGIKSELIMGESVEIIFPQSSLNVTMQLIKKAESGFRLEDTEIDVIHKNGGINTLIFNSTPIMDDKGETLIATIAQGQNITKYKKAKQELNLLHEQKELILCSISEGVLGLDLKGNHTFVNHSAAKMLGYQPHELIGLHSHSIWHHTKADGSPYPQGDCPIYKTFRDAKIHSRTNEVFWRKNGKSFPVEFASMPMYEQGKLIGAVVTFTDVTEQLKTENALKQSEQNMKAFVMDSLLCIYFFNTETKKIVYANPSFCALLGYSSEEIETLTIYDFLNHPPKSVDAFVNHVVRTKQRNIGERQWKRKDGKMIDMFVNASHGDHNESNIIYISAQDISERKKAEKELKESVHFLKESQKISEIGSYILDVFTGKWIASEELDKVFGISANDNHTIERWLSFIHPEHSKTMNDYFAVEVIEKRKRFDKEYKIINQITQEERWVHGIGELEFDHNNIPVKMMGTIQDVTERKKAQQKIIESENKFRSVLQSAKDSIILVNEKGCIVFWNNFAEKIFGYKEIDVLGKPVTMLIPEEFSASHSVKFGHHVSKKSAQMKDKIINLYGLKKNGSKFPIEISLSHWTNEKGKFYCGIIRDITERKNAEEEQKNHIKKLSEIAFLQSHQVRRPVASILGLTSLFVFDNPSDPLNSEVISRVEVAAKELDMVIREIVKKTSEIEKVK